MGPRRCCSDHAEVTATATTPSQARFWTAARIHAFHRPDFHTRSTQQMGGEAVMSVSVITVSKLVYTAALYCVGVESFFECSASGQADKHGRTPLSVAAPVSVAWPLTGFQRTAHPPSSSLSPLFIAILLLSPCVLPRCHVYSVYAARRSSVAASPSDKGALCPMLAGSGRGQGHRAPE